MKKKETSPLSNAAGKMPFYRVYEDGVVESVKNYFTEMFSVEQVRIQDAEVFKYKMNQLYLAMPGDCQFQIVVHNALVEKEDYLRSVLVPQDKMAQSPIYNRTILEMVDIGCNNVQKRVYLVVGKSAGSIEKSRNYFEEQRPVIEKAFGEIKLHKMNVLERLEMLYGVFHPKKNDFTRLLDLRNDGNIRFDNLKYLKLTEKELVAPKTWDTKMELVNHTILDKELETQCFSRTLFLNCIPREVSVNVVSDLNSVSGNMLFSMQYNPVDARLGYEAVSEVVKKNTRIVKKQKRETIQDKKNHTIVTFSERKEVNEEVYQSEAALETTKQVVASNSAFMEVSSTITIFADTLEELEKMTEMLRISAAKYACSVKCLDMLQYEAFCSSLPLGKQRVNVSRFLNSERLAQLSPISATMGIRRGGAFLGLNAINDNLIFYDRKQGLNLSGVITGVEYSGKTYQMKREILNAMLTSKDTVNVVVFDDSFDIFIESLGGSRAYLPELNPFAITEGYGLTIEDILAKRIFLSAFIKEEREVEQLLQEAEHFNDREYIKELLKSGAYPRTEIAMKMIFSDMLGNKGTDRLRLYKVRNKEELLITMEYLWNQSVTEKKNGQSNWYFIEPVDCLMMQEATLNYLLWFLKSCSAIKNVATVVLQDAVGVIASSTFSSIAMEEVVSGCGYVKLLNQGPVERKKFVELLNIPNALIPYITNVEPGQGLLITPASSVAFDDNFLERGHEFTELFRK